MKKLIIVLLIVTPNFLFAQLVSDFRVNDDTSNIYQDFDARIGADAIGNFVIVWRNNRNINGAIYCQLYNKNAQRIGNNFLISDNSRNPDVAVRRDGSFGVCWSDTVPKFRLFDKNGLPISAIKPIENIYNNPTIPPRISCDTSGNFVVVYQKYYAVYNENIHFQRFDNLGNKIGISTRVNDDTLITCKHLNPAVTMRKDGSYIITWQDQRPPAVQDGDDIYMQMYDKNGIKIGSNYRVNNNTVTLDYQFKPLITSDSLGRFYIAYNEITDLKNNFSGNSKVFCQLFNANGLPNGNNFVAATHPQDCLLEAIDCKKNGDFMITFYEGSLSWCQRISSNGSLIGNYYLISNQYPSIPKTITDIAITGDKVISTWYDIRNGTYDIFCNIRAYNKPDSITSIFNITNEIPSSYSLSQNYPNPFNPITNIKFDVMNGFPIKTFGNDKASGTYVKLVVYDIMGKEVQTLVNERLQPGTYSTQWNAANYTSGVYFYKMQTESFTETKRMLLIK